jgi:choline-sulfatase
LMPALESLGREAVVFEQAITVAPLTLPSHVSLLTGMYPPRHGVRDNQGFALSADVPAYPSWLKHLGYATGAFVSAVVLDHRYGLNRGFDVYDDEIKGPERTGGETLARAERWIDQAPRPFFLWVHLFEPHAPYRTGTYASEVTAVDTALAGFYKHLRDARMWDDSVVSVTADHGESLGEHGEQTHGFFLYDATLRIPWILKAPGLTPRRVPQVVRIVDEMPTILDVAGVANRGDGAHAQTDGVSVASLTRGGALDLEAYSETFLPRDQFGWSSLASLRTGRVKYIEAPQPELYELTTDPGETRNIVSSEVSDAVRLKRVITAIAHSPGIASHRLQPDPLIAEKLMSLGYIGDSPAAEDHAGARLSDPKTKLDVYNLTMTALTLSESGHFEAALAAIDRAERIDPHVAQIELLKGTLLGQIGQNEHAIAALQAALALDPGSSAIRLKLAHAWLRVGRNDRAAEALREVLRQQPTDFRAWHDLAVIAYSRGDLEEAEGFEKKAVALSPGYAEAWNTLGAIALAQKRTDAALDALTRATHLAPQNAQALHNLSLAFQAAGFGERARAARTQACAIDTRFCSTSGGRP